MAGNLRRVIIPTDVTDVEEDHYILKTCDGEYNNN